jgi:hypothetical protein
MVRLLALMTDSQRNYRMRRFLALALVLGTFSMAGIAGCGETAKNETSTTTTTPGGTTTETKTDKIKTEGANPPAPANP